MSTGKALVKEKAKKFLLHLLEDKNDKPSSKPSSDFPAASNDDALLHSFDSLKISNDRYHSTSTGFVGGFNTTRVSATALDLPPSSFHPPSKIPVPLIPSDGRLSLTMQMALEPEKYSLTPSATPHPGFHPSLTLNECPSPPQPTCSPFVPESFTEEVATHQCAGVTKAGKRCNRQVKSGPALFHALDKEDHFYFGDHPIERFCFQHSKELLEPSGFYSRKNGNWVKFSDWIPLYLQSDTQVALRVEMEKSLSQSDVPGYIYTFEIRGTSDTDVSLKVGRAVNLVKRIDQWGKQCGSKEQVLRGWYPGVIEPDIGKGSLMKGRIRASEKAPWCHRMERLIHLELADLLATGVYLDREWPHPQVIEAHVKSILIKGNKSEPCTDCGAIHKEIFIFKRMNGKNNGKEWELVVQPVIEKWGSFVSQFV